MTEIKKNTEKENFASRWSRRKRQLKHEQDPVDASTVDTVDEIGESGKIDAVPSDAEQIRANRLAELNTLKDEDMPDIATLNEESDYAQFMSSNVSAGLRKLALRKLFQGETYNIRDGLDEYDGDYTSFEKLDPGTITADLKYRQQLEAEKLKAKLEYEQEHEVEGASDKDDAEQQQTDHKPQDPAQIDDQNLANSDQSLQQSDEQDQPLAEITPADSEPSADQIARKTTGENQV